MKQDEYEYRPLGNNEIRVLQRLAGEELKFDLVHLDLDGKEDYCALSYLWGAEVFPKAIHLGNHIFHVAENLYDVLQVLWGPQPQNQEKLGSKIKCLWVDAICINQNDLSERNAQVPLMKRIYEQAHEVFAWLGKAENEDQVQLGVHKMAEFSAGYFRTQLKNKPLWPATSTTLERIEWDMYSFLSNVSASDTAFVDVEGSTTHTAWLGIFALWRSPWWGRTWILQEATVPESGDFWAHFAGNFGDVRVKSKVIFLCGNSSTNWNDFLMALNVAAQLRKIPNLPTKFAIPNWECFHKVYLLRLNREKRLKLPLSLLPLLQRSRHTESKDPRDKVYAPLGLSEDGMKERIVVDYMRPILEVYRDVPIACMADSGHELDFLGYSIKQRGLVDHSKRIRESTLPSWIPDWDEPIFVFPVPKDSNVYNASRRSLVSACLDGNSLKVDGARCDIIKDIMLLTGSHEKVHETLSRWQKAANGKYITGESFSDAYHRTSTMDVKFDAYGRVVGRNDIFDFQSMGKRKDEPTMEDIRLGAQFDYSLSCLVNRSMCLTEKGYLGLVPSSTEVGDLVCVFLGSRVLHILRHLSFGSEYEYIGECYAHGLMDGKAMDWVEDGTSKVEQFVLV